MAFTRSPFSRITVFLVLLALPTAVFAGGFAKMTGGGSNIEWQLESSSYASVELRVSKPDGQVDVYSFKQGMTPAVNLRDLGGMDGHYQWEMVFVSKVPEGVQKQLEAARAANDVAAAAKIMKDAGIESRTESGAFTVNNGMIVAPDRTEGKGREIAVNANRPGNIETLDQVIPDDLIVQGSACVGLDCVNNENFGFDTIRMKENNLRVHFDDTSTQAGFPANDWRLIANDSASGGSSKFSIEDSTSAKTPFTITAGAATNSIFADSTGRIGLRTSTPVLDLHINTSNTPAIRLEQNNSGGFTAQTWDIGANEANFFVRDVTGGSKLSLRIRPGAPTSSVDISADGDVGIGTGSPDQKLHAEESSDENTIILSENTNSTGLSAAGVVQAKADVAVSSLIAHGSGRTTVRFGQTIGGFSELLNAAGDGLIVGTLGAQPLILGTNSAARLTIDSAGAVTIPGSLTVTGTKNFGVPDPADASKAIYFSALEGPEAGTYYRGTAKTVNGEVVIKLPGHFTRMTENERMTVQLTPVGAPGQLYVASRTPEQIVIKVADGSADLEFDYLVQGVRRGYLDFQVERENNLN